MRLCNDLNDIGDDLEGRGGLQAVEKAEDVGYSESGNQGREVLSETKLDFLLVLIIRLCMHSHVLGSVRDKC